MLPPTAGLRGLFLPCIFELGVQKCPRPWQAFARGLHATSQRKHKAAKKPRFSHGGAALWSTPGHARHELTLLKDPLGSCGRGPCLGPMTFTVLSPASKSPSRGATVNQGCPDSSWDAPLSAAPSAHGPLFLQPCFRPHLGSGLTVPLRACLGPSPSIEITTAGATWIWRHSTEATRS